MSFTEISKVLSKYFFYLSAILLIPLSVSFVVEWIIEKQSLFSTSATTAFLQTIVITLFLAALFFGLGRHSKRPLYRKESIFVVVLMWILTSVIAAIPFLLTGVLKSPVDAL